MDAVSANLIGVRVEGCGPPIVLLHSSMSSKSQWSELIESLRDCYRLIAIDLIGYGDTVMPAGEDYSLDDEVRRVESVLARELRAGEPFHLVGHSYGGMVALQLAAQSQPPALRSLSLFEPVAFHLLPERDPDLAVVRAVWREIAGWFESGDARGAAACFVDYWSGPDAFGNLRATRQMALAAQVPKILAELRAVAEGARNAAAYRRIEVPICLVNGLWSPEPAQRLTSMFVDMLPQARCVEVAAGHMAPITHPELVNPILAQFIRGVDATERSRTIARCRDTHATRLRSPVRATAFGLAGVVLSVLPLFATESIGQRYFDAAPAVTYPLEERAWRKAPPGLEPGGTFAVVSGDPLAAGPFVMRVRLPPGYSLPPYRWRNDEEMVVLAGAITLGTREPSGATSTRNLTAGSYALLSANELHSAHTLHGAIVQIFGMGPFESAS